jgi:hypothetical protein
MEGGKGEKKFTYNDSFSRSFDWMINITIVETHGWMNE